MAVKLLHTETALADCREHLELCERELGPQGSLNPAIQAYLARHIAVVLCAEIEVTVTQLIQERVAQCGDGPVLNLLRSVRGNLVRNARPQEIGDKLKLFGVEFKERYDDRIEATVGAGGVSKLSIAVSKRDDASHVAPPEVTFKDIQEAYEVALVVVESVRIALELPDR